MEEFLQATIRQHAQEDANRWMEDANRFPERLTEQETFLQDDANILRAKLRKIAPELQVVIQGNNTAQASVTMVQPTHDLDVAQKAPVLRSA